MPPLPGTCTQVLARLPFQPEVEKHGSYFRNEAQTGKRLHRGRTGIWCQIPELLIEVNTTGHIEDGFYLSQQESSTAELTQNNSTPLLLSPLLYSTPNDFSPPYPIIITIPDLHFAPHLGPAPLRHQRNSRHKDHKKNASKPNFRCANPGCLNSPPSPSLFFQRTHQKSISCFMRRQKKQALKVRSQN